ncbi:hypothetical protein ONZ45_g14091 [Pleurotus djamor]|nr:hypothetical protein ONZ45_g14091 [Pleurotus djamor]
MPRRQFSGDSRPHAAFQGLLGVGVNVQTAPRRDVARPPLPLPDINEGSTGTRSTTSSIEYTVGTMDLDDDERARLRELRRRQKKMDLVVSHQTQAALDDNFTKCQRCNLWINCRDQALHRKGCPTLETSPINASRESDYRNPITSSPPSHAASGSGSSMDPYVTRGRSGYPGSPRTQHRSQSIPHSPSIQIPDHPGRNHDYHPYYDVSPIISRPAPPYTSTLPPTYTSYEQRPYRPPGPYPPPATAIPIYPSGNPQPHYNHNSRPQRQQHTQSSQHLTHDRPFAHLENDPNRSRSYGHHF